MESDIKKENGKKTYVVYQDRYSCTPPYNVYDPSDEMDSMPPEWDLIEQFEAEDGAEWFGYSTNSYQIKHKYIEEDGYTFDELDEMDRKELHDTIVNIVSKEDLNDLEYGSGITECDEDRECEAYDLEDYGDCFVVTVEVKFKFTLDGNYVSWELVK